MKKINSTEQSTYKRLSQVLYDLFFVDEFKYGRQLENGTYRLIKAKVSPVTIDDMLLNGKSLLTYQESHTLQTAFIKWVCLDLDIDKKQLDIGKSEKGDEHRSVSIEELTKVKTASDTISAYLTEKGIPHLLEFSGRRGFHIWIIFDKSITKQQGYQLAKLIETKVQLEDSVNLDIFPKTGYVAKTSKGIGSGVKLPLSVNKNSGYLSYFLKNGIFDFENYIITDLTEPFMASQLEILQNRELASFSQIEPLLKEYDNLAKNNLAYSRPYLNKVSLKVGTDGANLDLILEALKKCQHLKEPISNYRKELTLKERSMFVGLLAQLTTAKDQRFGHNLLMEFFSRVSGFRKDLTEQKLSLSKYFFPVTCASLGKCETCNCEPIRSPIELVKNIEILPAPEFAIENISKSVFSIIVEAEIKYSKINDEIPLYNHLEKLKNLKYEEISEMVESIFCGHFPQVTETFSFERNEVDKVRTLYVMEPHHAVISTYFLFLLNNIFYTEISPNSYGYRIAPGFYNNNIFSNWFVNWGAFSKNIQRMLENEEYDGYYLVKVDIRNFYDRIDQQLLKVKLYEEALPSIDARIKSLTKEEQKKYLNIVKYLIYLSEQTVESNIGLPQGPAYARYLAEFYLLGFDKLIEADILKDRRREFYYRFVDDIFVFVESEEKAHQVLSSIEGWSSSNTLELNPKKTELISVLEYARSGKFKKFQDDAKYAINQANKNKELLSEDERREVIAKVEKLTDESKFGLKDNLRFFYYQFSGDDRLKHIKEKIARMLPFSDNGRGTLFMLLYADLFQNQNALFWKLSEEQSKITGLSLGHYLNTILLNIQHCEDKSKTVEKLITQLSLRLDLSYADKSLMLTLMMKFNISAHEGLLSQYPDKLIFSVMQTPNLEYNESNYDLLYRMLESKQDVDFINILYDVIHLHPMTPVVAERLAKYTFVRFSIWMNRDDIKQKLTSPLIGLKYYHCLCFLTLFDRNEDPNPVQTSWKILLSLSTKIDLQGIKITFGWINNAIKIFSGNLSANAFGLLLADRSGSDLNVYNCQNNFISLFKDILLIFYFTKEELNAEMIEKKEALLGNDTLFGEWLFSNQTTLYPIDKDLCIRNLALNGLIVLQNPTEIFLKNINGHLEHSKFSYLDSEKKIDDTEIVVSKSGAVAIKIFESVKDLPDLLVKLGQQIESDIAFRDTFDVGYPVYYDFPFQKDGNPLIPFYSVFGQKISNLAITQNNDVKSYWENLLTMASKRNEVVKLLDHADHPFNFTFKDLSERFIPKSDILIRTDQDRLDFVVAFSKEIDGKTIQNMFEFQYSWSKVLWNIINNRSVTSVRKFLEFLHIHFQTFEKGPMGIIDVMFSIDSRTLPRDQNLQEFLNTIRNALVSFQSNVFLDDFSVVDLFDEEIQGFEEVLPEGKLLKDFIKLKLSFQTGYNAINGRNETNLFLEKDEVVSSELMVFDRSNNRFFNKSIEELNSTVGARQYYINKGESVLYIIPIDFEIGNAYSRVVERHTAYKAAEKTSNQKLLLAFPSSESYLQATTTYEQHKAVEIEKAVKNHFQDDENVKSRVVGWLNLFNESSLEGSKTIKFLNDNNYQISDLHKSVLDVLNLHIPVEDDDLSFFQEQLLKELDAGSLIFAIKDPRSDGNGLSRILELIDIKPRGIDFETSFQDMITSNLKDRTLVIATDITISGTQTEHGLNYYESVPETEEQHQEIKKGLVTSDERYFKFANITEFETCRKNFQEAKEVKIITPLSTDTFRENIVKHNIFGGKVPQILSGKTVSNEGYKLATALLDDHSRKIFYQLISDVELINWIFIIRKGYSASIKELGDQNILLRVRSLPKQHIWLFSLEPKNGGPSLLDYVQNWKKKRKK